MTQLMKVHSLIYLKIGSVDEDILSKSFQDFLSVLGEVIAGDEKLFRFTGQSGIIRKCPNKPARIGIWHYQAVVYLLSGLPFVIYTKAHVTTSSMGTVTQCCKIVMDWANIILSRHANTTLIIDSYYLSKAGRDYMNDKGVNYVAALKSDRFKKICDLLKPSVTESGQTSIAYNSNTKEAAVFHWSLDKCIGKRLVMTNAFRLFAAPTRKGTIPVYDFYNAGFAGCDQFNHRMHNRTWPFPVRRTKMGTDIACGWNYLFTTIVLNVWHIWIDIEPDTRMAVSFNKFMQSLASGLVSSKIPHGFDEPASDDEVVNENLNNENAIAQQEEEEVLLTRVLS